MELSAHSRFFDHLVDLVPAKFYLSTGDEKVGSRREGWPSSGLPTLPTGGGSSGGSGSAAAFYSLAALSIPACSRRQSSY